MATIAIPSSPGSSKAAPITVPSWIPATLTAMGAPLSYNNEWSMYFWWVQEGTTSQGDTVNNWLNIGPGRSYPTEAAGAAATAQTIQQLGIAPAFVKDQGPSAIWTAIHGSGWCGGKNGCGPDYPGALKSAIQAGGGAVISGSAVGQSNADLQNESNCTPIIKTPGVGSIGSITILDKCQAKEILGVLLIVGSGVVFLAGIAAILSATGPGKAALGAASMLPGGVGTTARVAGGQGKQVGAERRSQATRTQAQTDRLEAIDARGQQSRRNGVKNASQPLGSLPTDDQPF